MLHLAEEHNIDVREGLPNLIRKEGVKVFVRVGTKVCIDSLGIWSHGNVNNWKMDAAPQEGLLEILLEF